MVSASIYFRLALALHKAGPSAKDIYFLESCREKRGGGGGEICEHGEAIFNQNVINENKILQFLKFTKLS